MHGFAQSCLDSGYTPKIATISEDIYADIRDTSVKEHGWMYPTFASGSVNLEDGVVAVPVKDPVFYAVFYIETTKSLPDISERITHVIRNALARDDDSIM